MKTQNIIEGLQLLDAATRDKCSVCAEHDQIWAGPEDQDLIPYSVEDQLTALGWFYDEDMGRWSAFV